MPLILAGDHRFWTLFNESSLSPLWRLAHWSYGSESPLLLMDRGRIAKDLLSAEGVRQGDVLGSLLFALSMTRPHGATLTGLDCHAVAVMDDFYLFGPPTGVFTAFDRFAGLLPSCGLQLKLSKCKALLPSCSDVLVKECKDRDLPYSDSYVNALGTILSRDPIVVSDYLVKEVTEKHKLFFTALLDQRLSHQHYANLYGAQNELFVKNHPSYFVL